MKNKGSDGRNNVQTRIADHRTISVVGENRAELVHFLKRHARTTHHACERIVSYDNRQPGFFHQQPVKIAQQCTATC